MLSPLIAFSAEIIASLTSSPRDATSICATCLDISGIAYQLPFTISFAMKRYDTDTNREEKNDQLAAVI